LGGLVFGADGVIVEVHPRPDEALSDAEQQLDLPAFAAMMVTLGPVHERVRSLHGDPLAGHPSAETDAAMDRH
jgi:3-deoxy-D-manno-octulosonic acid (KDO) 8-phosphate synthase